jgi:L-lactate dehydrogenase (cytochrome)
MDLSAGLFQTFVPMGNKIFSTSDARKYARRRLPRIIFDFIDGSARIIFDFIDGSAGEERACAFNVEQIESLRMLPRVLVNVENRNHRKALFDQSWDLPFGIAPMEDG